MNVETFGNLEVLRLFVKVSPACFVVWRLLVAPASNPPKFFP